MVEKKAEKSHKRKRNVLLKGKPKDATIEMTVSFSVTTTRQRQRVQTR
jgi:hypothetical protein